MTSLFSPLTIGDLTLPNRIVMAPLTRSRSADSRIPNALMAEYYAQRASAGLILSEATSITPLGVGYAATPGIWSAEQTDGWKLVTEAVHRAGGRIMLQLWHVGRISDPLFLNGAQPVAPSAIRPKGRVSLVRPLKDYVTPRALETDEIPVIVEAYRRAAENAKLAGFDGVELHGANGYLLDQFLQSGANQRTDRYGGSLENRARLMLDAVDAAIAVWGPGRVGLHLSPRGDFHDMHDDNPLETFSYVATQMRVRQLAFLCVRESLNGNRIGPALKQAFGGAYIANEGFTRETAEQVVNNGEADAVAFGKLFIANPDLPARFAANASLNPPDTSSFYGGDAQGYTDYAFLEKVA